jgi:two-component system, chemotaxis family, protein-glutamate methylesterase/glutaminase
MPYDLIMVGSSLGGLKALQTLLSELSTSSHIPLVIVQHRDRDIDNGGLLSYVLQKSTPRRLDEAVDKMPILHDRVYLAPADYHLLVENDRLVLSMEPPVAHARPSIDVAFETAARCYGPGCVGVILTGYGTDGAKGLAQVERRGGLAIVQAPASAEQPAMPNAAIANTRSPTILDLESIASFLIALEASGGQSKNASRASR